MPREFLEVGANTKKPSLRNAKRFGKRACFDVDSAEGLDMRWSSFAVVDVRVVDSRRVRIMLDADVPRLTLVTCYPFDAIVPGGPLRWVVTADRL